MRSLHSLVIAALVALLGASGAQAHVLHTVVPGETLWSIAAQSNLTTRTVAAYNGLSPDARIVLGSTLKIPSVAEGAAALAASGAGPATAAATGATGAAPAAAVLGATGAAPATAARGTTTAIPTAPRAQGAYVVRAGDTLSGLAAQTGVSMEQMAWMNGLDPAAILLTGTLLKLPNGAPAPARASTPLPAARVVAQAAPMPSAGRVGAGRVKQLAAEHGAPGSLVAAIAWQESGFNNAVVSSANARGVMQVMPGTWEWVQRNLGLGALNPTSAEDNVRAGSAYLARLLRETGGDVRLAAASYYQGLYSVRTRGMFDDTRRYVDNVMALRARFGG
jgi:soluble lytic murein transglycosylase-like protein